MDTERFNEKNLAKHKERCDMIEQLAIAEEENRKLGIRADKLEQRLESETRKAERRMRHIDLMGAALTERRNQLHERGERIAELEKQVADLRAELEDTNRMLRESDQLSERERAILDMWPCFEDGEPVWFGDSVEHDGTMETVQGFKLYRCGPAYLSVVGIDTEKWLRIEDYKSVKRPAPKVLDVDGVEIKVGDTVWNYDGVEMTVTSLVGELPGHVTTHSKIPPAMHSIDPKRLSHTRPDSWERLEEDALNGVCEYAGASSFGHIDAHDCDTCRFCNEGDGPSCEEQMARDIIRRAKALAGVEVGE